MLQRGRLLFMVTLCFACDSSKEYNEESKPKIAISYNSTIETFMIARALSDNDPILKYREPNFDKRPMLYSARNYFQEFIDHPAVKETQEMLSKTSSTGDIIFQGLLYAEELPSAKIIHPITSKFWKENPELLKGYLDVLKDFYLEASVSSFLKSTNNFYQGAISEIKNHINEDQINSMEEYFGKSNKAYRVIIIPISPFGMGFGASVGTEGEKIFYEIISPSNDIDWKTDFKQYTEFGYSGEGARDYLNDLVIHEFCHSFITPVIEQPEYMSKINNYDSLYTDLMDSIMQQQGYGSWWHYFNEYLVRLSQIRIAEGLQRPDEVQKLREVDIYKNKFVLIGKGEELIHDYENNRNKYKVFEDFIPFLINQLENYTKGDIDSMLTIIDKSNRSF